MPSIRSKPAVWRMLAMPDLMCQISDASSRIAETIWEWDNATSEARSLGGMRVVSVARWSSALDRQPCGGYQVRSENEGLRGSDNRNLLQTLQRGAAVLDLFADHDYLTLKGVASTLELSNTIAFRLLKTWESAGYLSYDKRSKRYYPGISLLRLSTKTRTSSGLPEIDERLASLSSRVHLTASFTVLSGRFVLYVARVVANRSLMYQVDVGKTLPAYATSSGHVLLANLSNTQLRDLFPEDELFGFTDKTPRSHADLLAAIELVRKNGFAVNKGQFGDGVGAVAVPARDELGEVVGAFSVAGAAIDFSDDQITNTYLPALLSTAVKPVSLYSS